jgi:hypothetical protein
MIILGTFHAKYLVNKFPGTLLSPNTIIAQAVLEEKKIFYFRHYSDFTTGIYDACFEVLTLIE